jgi:hypothetical protein
MSTSPREVIEFARSKGAVFVDVEGKVLTRGVRRVKPQES